MDGTCRRKPARLFESGPRGRRTQGVPRHPFATAGMSIATSIPQRAHNLHPEKSMPKLSLCLFTVLALTGAAALAQAQTSTRASTAPGVTRAIEHPDTTPDPTVDQTQPDSHQPETASDPRSSGPQTARDDPKLGKPETATDVPKQSQVRKAAEHAAQGVRSNTPPPSKPQN
jgi:hypothetical protein